MRGQLRPTFARATIASFPHLRNAIHPDWTLALLISAAFVAMWTILFVATVGCEHDYFLRARYASIARRISSATGAPVFCDNFSSVRFWSSFK